MEPFLFGCLKISFTVNINIVDEDQKKAIPSYDPQAPVTRKGVLRSLRTGRPIEIREEDLVGYFKFIFFRLKS